MHLGRSRKFLKFKGKFHLELFHRSVQQRTTVQFVDVPVPQVCSSGAFFGANCGDKSSMFPLLVWSRMPMSLHLHLHEELKLHSCPAGHCGVRGFRTFPRTKKVRRQGGSRVRTCCRTRCRPRGPPVRSSTCSTGSYGGGASGIQTPGGWWTQRMEPGSALSYGGPRGSSALPLHARAERVRIWTLTRRVLWVSHVHSIASKNSRIQECPIFYTLFSCMFRS